MWEDPIVSDVRRIREELSERFSFDVSAIFADIRKRQTTLGSRLVRRKRGDEAEPTATNDQDSTPLHPGR